MSCRTIWVYGCVVLRCLLVERVVWVCCEEILSVCDVGVIMEMWMKGVLISVCVVYKYHDTIRGVPEYAL